LDVNYNGSLLFEPPKRVKKFYYRCSKHFILDKVVDMYLEDIKYGLVLISGRGFMFFNLIKTGSHVDIQKIYDSTVKLQKKQKKGGQSAPRFERIRQEKELQYIKKVSDKMIKTFMINNNTSMNVNGIIVGGPAQLKRKVVEHSDTQKMFGDKIIKVVDTEEIDSSIAWDVYEKSLKELATDEEKESIDLINEIKLMMSQADEKLTYGIDETLENLKCCMLEKILVSSDINISIKKKLKKLNTYDCQIIETNPTNLRSIGINIIGIKWYA